jgi:hypothetical protein
VTARPSIRRGLIVGGCISGCVWIAVAMGIAAAFDFNAWQWAETALPMGE